MGLKGSQAETTPELGEWEGLFLIRCYVLHPPSAPTMVLTYGRTNTDWPMWTSHGHVRLSVGDPSKRENRREGLLGMDRTFSDK